MAYSSQSLWPETIEPKTLPAPVALLEEQGTALAEKTNDLLYGEVEQSNFPSVESLNFDFYIGVTGKPIRHKLLSLECGFLFDYPVTILNHEAGTTARAATESSFQDQIRMILNSHVTQDLLGRLLTFAG